MCFMMALVIGLTFSSCSNDPCIVGNWHTITAPFCAGTKLSFAGDGTGQITVLDCTNSCPDSDTLDQREVEWLYDDGSGILTIKMKPEGMKCGIPYTFQADSLKGSLTCNGYAATITTTGALVQTYTFERD